jgi:hypothetical protein
MAEVVLLVHVSVEFKFIGLPDCMVHVCRFGGENDGVLESILMAHVDAVFDRG